jgi:hypothetical protein
MQKRKQIERLTVAYQLVSEVYEEVMKDKVEPDLLQTAAYIQMDVDRLVWKLNQLNKGGRDEKSGKI